MPSAKLRRITPLLLSLLLGIMSPDAHAKSPSAMTASEAEVKRYLQGKYKIEEFSLMDRNGPDPNLGRWRSLQLGGEAPGNDLTPPAIALQGAIFTKDPRTIARVFLTEEADLFGLTAISEMREISMNAEVLRDPSLSQGVPGTHTSLSYYHYLNGLKLDGALTGMAIGPTGKIVSVYADMVNITPQLLEAVKSPGLAKIEIHRVIKKDLIAHGEYPEKVTYLADEKYAIPMPPYVVWGVVIRGDEQDAGSVLPRKYLADAFTGRIISKDSPCDRVGSCMPNTDSPLLKIIDSISKKPIKNTPVRIYSDNGIRCITEPCNTNGISWEGKTDAHGVLVIPGTVVQYSMHLSVNGYRSDLREAKAEARGSWSIALVADRHDR